MHMEVPPPPPGLRHVPFYTVPVSRLVFSSLWASYGLTQIRSHFLFPYSGFTVAAPHSSFFGIFNAIVS